MLISYRLKILFGVARVLQVVSELIDRMQTLSIPTQPSLKGSEFQSQFADAPLLNPSADTPRIILIATISTTGVTPVEIVK
jgi:hypothetical protein